jgi:hypothetical protein
VLKRSARQVLTAMVAMFNSGDVGGVDELVHAEYYDHQGLDGEPMHGPSGFARVVAVARSGYAVLDVTIEDLMEESDRAAARLRWRGVRRSGESVELETLEMIHVREGRAVEHWGARS